MPAATRVFDQYEQDYLSNTRQAAQGLERLANLPPGAEKQKLLKSTAGSLDAADQIVQQMELEARSMSGEIKAELVSQAKDYKEGIAMLRRKLKAAQVATSTKAEEQARAELFAMSDPTLRKEAEAQHARLLQSTERMVKGTEKLRAARQVDEIQGSRACSPSY